MNSDKKEGNMPVRRNMFPDFFGELSSFFDNDFLPGRLMSGMSGRLMQNTPATNIRENDNNYQIEIAAPGLNKEDFNVDIESGTITISSEKKEEREEKEGNYTRREYNFSSFSRSFRLPETVNEDEIDATYKDGVLILTIPKKEEAKKPPRRQINIK